MGLTDATQSRMAKTFLYAQTPLHAVHPTIMVYLHSKSVLFIQLVKYLRSFKLTLF